MRTTSAAVRVVLASVAAGAALTGCADDSAAKEPSAQQMLRNADKAMSALKSVTINSDTTSASTGDGHTSRLTTNFKDRCTFRTTSKSGAVLEQIRVGATDYIRPNRAYLKESGRNMTSTGEQNRWIKTSSSTSTPGDGLADCTWTFSSFGTVGAKGERAKVNGTPATPVTVTDKADKGGTYTVYIAAEGKPYILQVAYKGPKYRTTTSFSDFDEPLTVRPPAEADVLDLTKR
ncbi:hypothetical protein C6376_40415 [Streptomyces sp. P3]|uniref:hypothetical protein n=1 Tax=unclassified Streptomyces TaxID=2593676 RepID=UPI000D1A9282|nr:MULTISPECIES: hypothetical protein [unclassified Streptomyces]AVV46685.1 hypothetical protein C6376_40415 [Streptomyces sp. P3]